MLITMLGISQLIHKKSPNSQDVLKCSIWIIHYFIQRVKWLRMQPMRTQISNWSAEQDLCRMHCCCSEHIELCSEHIKIEKNNRYWTVIVAYFFRSRTVIVAYFFRYRTVNWAYQIVLNCNQYGNIGSAKICRNINNFRTTWL